MALFVHLAPLSSVKLIQRNGIRRAWKASDDWPGGIFAMPGTRNFYVSHQWLRELRRWKKGPFFGVYCRIPDDQAVFVGH